MTKRVAIVADANTHLGPDLARILAERGHDLVLGDPIEVGSAHDIIEAASSVGYSVGSCKSSPIVSEGKENVGAFLDAVS